MGVVVRVPGSSANLGAGFDALGMALTLYARIGVLAEATSLPPRALITDDRHPATVAFRRAGGEGRLWLRCEIPSGRGLGFSGAVRVGGLLAAIAQRRVLRGEDATGTVADAREEVLAIATDLEGHADNAAASLFGGVVATAGGVAVRVPVVLAPVVVTWVAAAGTSTDQSRGRLPTSVPRADAVFNIGRTALLVAALAAGDVDALRVAVDDRLHQDTRFTRAPDARRARDTALAAGAWASWLSGSGPTVASLCAAEDAPRLAAAIDGELGDAGRTMVLAIDGAGAVVEAATACTS